MLAMRVKISISVPAILSTGLFILGLLAIFAYSMQISGKGYVNEFSISINVSTLLIYLFSLMLCTLSLFMLLKVKGK